MWNLFIRKQNSVKKEITMQIYECSHTINAQKDISTWVNVAASDPELAASRYMSIIIPELSYPNAFQGEYNTTITVGEYLFGCRVAMDITVEIDAIES